MTTLVARAKRRTMREIFEVYIAFLAITSGTFYIFFPDAGDASVLRRALEPITPLDIVWNAVFMLGGALMLAGILKDHGGRLEQAGLGCVATAVVTYAASLLYIRGTAGIVSAGLSLAVVVVCVTRMVVIDRLSRAIIAVERESNGS